LDGKRETRPCRKKHGLGNGLGYYKRQREVETSCKNLIVGEHVTEERKRRRSRRKNEYLISHAFYVSLISYALNTF